MNKEELTKIAAEEAGVTEEEAAKIIEAFFETIKEGLLKGERVLIAGFGTFSLSKRKEREFVNPKTRKIQTIKERILPFFKADRNFKKD